VIAYGILATSELKDSLLLTTPIVLNKQVLVQRKLENVPDSSLFIKSQLDLAGKTLHVVKGSPSILRIRNLGNEIGDTIYVEEIEKYGPEQLIALVAHGDIDYAVCDESIAYRSRQYSSNRHQYRHQLHAILFLGGKQTVPYPAGQPQHMAG